MELISIIYVLLKYSAAVLAVVLLFSYILSKMRNGKREDRVVRNNLPVQRPNYAYASVNPESYNRRPVSREYHTEPYQTREVKEIRLVRGINNPESERKMQIRQQETKNRAVNSAPRYTIVNEMYREEEEYSRVPSNEYYKATLTRSA